MNPRENPRPTPVEIRLKRAEKVLEVDFDDGASFRYEAEFLRVESPSAEVQGHGPGQKILITGRRHVGILALKQVGNYAVRLSFDDLHDTGIFTWDYLYELGQSHDRLRQEYFDALKSRGLSRDPPVRT